MPISTPAQSVDAAFKIGAKAVVELGISQTFERFCDVAFWEQKARGASVKVDRLSGTKLSVGSSWDIEAVVAKRKRIFTVRVLDFKKPDLLLVAVTSRQFLGHSKVTFRAKEPDLTNVRVVLSLSPQTLSARLLLQGLKLTKHRQKRRLARGLRTLCRHLEAGVGPRG